MSSSSVNSAQSDKPIWYFISCWTILNAVQAYTLELHADEAYYWMYSRHLDWGYFDHPPMVAVFIRIGYAIFHNEFGLRLLTVLTSSFSLYVLWLIVKKYGIAAKWFIVIVAGVAIFNVYGFTTTPDAPLFFFTILFYYFYQQYIEDDKWPIALLLALIIAGLFYSKYHGALIVLFTLLSNLKLLRRKSFYGIVIISALLFLPHVLWQFQHNFPSLKYHLSDRSSEQYDYHFTLDYIPGQLLIAGPLIGWYLFYSAFTLRVKDAFIRCLMVNGVGTVLFFLLSTIKGRVEPHWTLIAFVPLTILALIHIQQSGGRLRWLFRLSVANVALLLLLRVAIIAGPPVLQNIDALKSYYDFKDWAHQVKAKAGDAWVVMDEGFQNPSKYNFYNNTSKGFAYDSRFYRKTQYDIWPMEDSLQHKRVYFLTVDPMQGVTIDTLRVKAGKWFGGWVADARTYQKVAIEPDKLDIITQPRQKVQFYLTITNPYPFDITFTNAGYQHKAFLEACFFQNGGDLETLQQAPANFNNVAVKKGESQPYPITVLAPEKKGRYDLVFSIRTEPFRGSKNSPAVSFLVE